MVGMVSLALSWWRSAVVSPLLVVTLTGALAAQDKDKPVPPAPEKQKPRDRAKDKLPHVNCPYCNHQGERECKKHGEKAVAQEIDGVARFCGERIDCKACQGTMWVDCDKCKNAGVEGRNQAELDKLAAWLKKKRDTVDALVQHPVLHGESEHFYLACDLKPMMIGKVRFSTHDLLHLYLERMEKLRDLFIEVFELQKGELPDVCDLYMWRDGRDQSLAAPKFAGMGHTGAGVKLMGAASVFTMHYDGSRLSGDENLHRHMVHNVSHLLLGQMTPPEWIGNIKGGWLDCGTGHYFEFRLDGKCTTYCYEEVMRDTNFKGGKWLVPVRRMVAAGDHPPFAEVAQKNTDQLEPKEHALSFSWVHFLADGDFADKGRGRKLVTLLRAIKAKRAIGEALREAYGWNALTFEEKWKEWVLRTYPTRES